MKLFLVIFSLYLSSAVFAAPSQEDSIINRIPKNHVHKWELKVDKDGETFLVDKNPLTEDPQASPMFEAVNDVQFWLYTRSNRNSHQRLHLNNAASVKNSNFVASKETRVIIHGWNNNGNSDVNKLIKDAFLDKSDCNVIVVDWGAGANHLVYSVSRGRINDVAMVVGNFIDFLNREIGAAIGRFLITGHSLGGHTACLASNRVTRGTIEKVVAVDPAGPLFSLSDKAGRCDSSKAKFVEIIHTNTGILGFSEPIGDVDFYPNWGNSQPGCGIDAAGTCAHGRAYEYYAESIRNGGYSATKCDNYNEMTGTMGIGRKCTNRGSSHMGREPLVTSKAHGVYYLETNSKAPYSKG